MNKQEALKRLEVQKETIIRLTGWAVYVYIEELIKSLDEPQPVKVPQFVAEKIEYFKKTGDWDLFQAMDSLFGRRETREWLEYKNNQETFARAWLDDYEVEEEKRYVVKVKGNIKENMLVYGEFLERYFFAKNSNLYNVIYFHTRKELEEVGFGWVFDCEGVEVEEVE